MLSSPNDESPANIEAAVSVKFIIPFMLLIDSLNRNNIVMIILNSRKKFSD